MSQLPTNSPESSAGLSRLTSVTEDKIAGLLRGYVESDCLQCPKDTIDSLLALLPENAPCSAEVFHVAEICLNIARTISYTETSHRTLALFLRDLSQSPKFVSELTLPGRGKVYHNHEALKDILEIDFRGTQAEDDPIQWVNRNAFMAHLESTGIWEPDPTYAIRAMRDAFETRQPRAQHQEYYIMAAAQWILWNGQALFQIMLNRQLPAGVDIGALAFGRFYTGPGTVLSLHRWLFWMESFETAGDRDELGEDCKGLASRAESLMRAMEKSMIF